MDTTPREKPFNFETPAEATRGTLRLGWRKFPISVVRFSWAGYTIHVSPRLAQLLWLGRIASLEYQGARYDVSCLTRERFSPQCVQVELVREDEGSIAKKVVRRTRAIKAASIRLNQRDPFTSVASVAALVMLLLVLPGWGEGWGTSRALTENFQTLFEGTLDACMSLCGR